MISRLAVPKKRLARWVRAITPSILLVMLLPVSLIAGLGISRAAVELGTEDRIIVGNTAGTLSTVIMVDGSMVVIGGGDSRSDLADLVGRATYPWHGTVHLLVIPGWDDEHAIGSLGLIERGVVEAIIVLGLPGADAIWTAIEREAERQRIALEFLSGVHRVPLSSNANLTLAAGNNAAEDQPSTAVITLQHDDAHVTILDGSPQAHLALVEAGYLPGETHLLVAARDVQGLSLNSTVLIRPRPFRARDVTLSHAPYEAELQRNERLTINVEPNRIRLPLDQLTRTQTTTDADDPHLFRGD